MVTNESLQEFAGSLSSKEPVPGGGAAAGYTGVLGTALAGMAIAYSKRNEVDGGGGEAASALDEGAALMERLRIDLLELTDKDCAAYAAFDRALKLPRSSSEEKASRRKEVRRALDIAMKVALDAASKCAQALERLHDLVRFINPRLITDAGISARCLGAALRSCWYNVLVNAVSLADDELVREMSAKREAMETAAALQEERVLKAVEEALFAEK